MVPWAGLKISHFVSSDLSNNGVNCLHLACQKNHLDMVKHLIIKYNYKLNEPTKGTLKLPLHIAV